MRKMPRVLVVEDEPAIAELIAVNLRHNGFAPTVVFDGAAAQREIDAVLPDVVLLDWMLPGESGVALAKRWRSQERTKPVPIIMLTARTEESDKVQGLDAGADDYVTKPFELRELLVRVKNLLWRISLAAAQPSEPAVADDAVRFGPWRFDIPRRQLSRDGVPVRLTKAEYEVLVAFIANAGRVLSRERILALTSHRGDGPSDCTIDVLIRRLRGKMEQDPRDPQLFVTVHGEGYLFAGELAA